MNQQSTTSNWNDFNDAESQQSGFDLIPKGTVVPVRNSVTSARMRFHCDPRRQS